MQIAYFTVKQESLFNTYKIVYLYPTLNIVSYVLNFSSPEEVYESSGRIAEDIRPYTDDTSKLKDNHMLMVMVNANRGELVSHPLVLGKDGQYRSLLLSCSILELY